MILVFQREREGDIVVKILEILNGKVIHLEHQPALHRTVMLLDEDIMLSMLLDDDIMLSDEDQPARRRHTMHPKEDQPALCRPIMHPEEDHGHPMHPEKGEPGVRVYGENCASVVGIYGSTTLFSSLLSHSAYYVRFLFLNYVFAI